MTIDKLNELQDKIDQLEFSISSDLEALNAAKKEYAEVKNGRLL